MVVITTPANADTKPQYVGGRFSEKRDEYCFCCFFKLCSIFGSGLFQNERLSEGAARYTLLCTCSELLVVFMDPDRT